VHSNSRTVKAWSSSGRVVLDATLAQMAQYHHVPPAGSPPPCCRCACELGCAGFSSRCFITGCVRSNTSKGNLTANRKAPGRGSLHCHLTAVMSGSNGNHLRSMRRMAHKHLRPQAALEVPCVVVLIKHQWVEW